MSKTLQTIVIGTSLSKTSDDVVRTGVAIARATGATPRLVHAYSLPAFPSELGAMDGSWLGEYVNALREGLAQQAQRTGLAGLPGFGPGQLHLTMGPTHGGIVDLARQVQADLVVVGAAESPALQRIFLGSTADGVIRQAPCPVFVVRCASDFPPTRVEVPVDLSPVAANALRQGLDFLAQTGAKDAETEVLFVLNPMEVAGSLHFTPEQVERFSLDELHRFLKANGAVPERARVRSGYPSEQILAALEERQADLVILGTHGRRGFERLMLGSVAIGVMHRAAFNLLIVPPGARRQPAAEAHEEEWVGADRSFVSDEVLV
ncbi:MAG: universal stress protein [Thermoanaerobaculia bacterium]